MAELSPERRFLLALTLSFLVLIVSSRYLFKPAPPAPAGPRPVAPAETKKEAAAAVSARARAGATPTKVGESEEEIAVENDRYRIVLSTRGGVIKSWTLKQYRDDKGGPLELVNLEAAQKVGFPGSLVLENREAEQRANSALYVATPPGGALHAPATITLEYSDGTLAVKKTFRCDASYVAQIESTVDYQGRPLGHQIAWRGGFGDIHGWNILQSMAVFWHGAGALTQLPANKVAERASVQGDFSYAGIEDRYFAAVFLPASETTAALPLRVTHWKDEVEQKLGEDSEAKKHPMLNVAVGTAEPELKLRLFVGPKESDLLERTPPNLSALLDFGWFWFIAKPLFLALKWLYRHGLPNYGWAIVILTVAINVVMFPLKMRSLESAQKMQKLAPQLRAIQEKYKKYKFNDPRRQEMNAEMMELYKAHGVNPLGGCIPLLLQIPFFYAFYKVLGITIEMRQAPWIRWWIKDLSAPDPTVIVLPGLMTLSMYITQKMTPVTTTDPVQQRMFTIMPLMFGGMFIIWQASSGLVLYWLMSNLVGIAQQWYINRRMRLAEIEAKAARRRGKLKESD